MTKRGNTDRSWRVLRRKYSRDYVIRELIFQKMVAADRKAFRLMVDFLMLANLQKLEIENVTFNQEHYDAVAKIIYNNRNLRVLNLRYIYKKTDGLSIVSISEALKNNDTIQELRLTCFYIDHGEPEFLETIRTHRSLKLLEIKYVLQWHYGNVLDAITHNTSITRLIWFPFYINERGFIDLLNINNTLRWLDINRITNSSRVNELDRIDAQCNNYSMIELYCTDLRSIEATWPRNEIMYNSTKKIANAAYTLLMEIGDNIDNLGDIMVDILPRICATHFHNFFGDRPERDQGLNPWTP